MILNINIQGLLNKKYDLELALETNKLRPAIITLCEHWLKESNHYIAETICNYRLVSINFRNKKQRGGTCILIRKDIKATACSDLAEFYEESIFECVGVKLEKDKNTDIDNCFVIAVYRTPSSNFTKFVNKLISFLSFLERKARKSSIFICGDFNIDQLKDNNETNTFNSVLRSFNYKVTILCPTRITKRSQTNIDNIITNLENKAIRTNVIELGLSDHTAQLLYIRGKYLNTKKKFISSRLLSSENRIRNFSELLGKEEWTSIIDSQESDKAYNMFLYKFQNLFLQCFPCKTFSLGNLRAKNQWMTQGLRISTKNKKYLYKTSKLTSDPKFHNYFKNYKIILKKVIKAAKKYFISSKLKKSNNIAKTTWQLVKKEVGFTAKSHNFSEILDDKGVIVKEVLNIANTFNDHFITNSLSSSQNISLTEAVYNLKHLSANNLNFNLFSVTQTDIHNVIKELDNKHSSGWDEIPTSLIKAISNYIVHPLTHIVNTVLKTGVFPNKLKFCNIFPIFKKGDSKILDSYRPVALLPSFSKIVEKVIFKQLIKYLEEHNILNEKQFGFRQGRSTQMAVFELVNELLGALDGSQTVYGVFCDLSKAFDSVNHKLLLAKLEYYGINGTPLKLFETYLYKRFQRVKINGADGMTRFSEWKEVQCGVPQGSILGPILFLLYINDMPFNINTPLYLFADDTTALIKGSAKENIVLKVNSTLTQISDWLNNNGLRLNCSKTKILNFSTNKNKAIRKEFIMPNKDICLDSDNVNFLGFTIQNNLKWQEQINSIQRKLSKSLYAIRMVAKIADINTSFQVYHGYFLSIVRYSIMLWGGSSYINKIFRLQKQAIRAIFHLKQRESCKPFFKSNNLLTIPALYIFEIFKFLKKYPKYFENSKIIHGHQTRNESLLRYPKHKLSLVEKGPYYMAIKLFNNIPGTLKKEERIGPFLNSIEHLLIQFCPYTIEEFIEVLTSYV